MCTYTFTDTSVSTDFTQIIWKNDHQHHLLHHVFLVLLERTNEQL